MPCKLLFCRSGWRRGRPLTTRPAAGPPECRQTAGPHTCRDRASRQQTYRQERPGRSGSRRGRRHAACSQASCTFKTGGDHAPERLLQPLPEQLGTIPSPHHVLLTNLAWQSAALSRSTVPICQARCAAQAATPALVQCSGTVWDCGLAAWPHGCQQRCSMTPHSLQPPGSTCCATHPFIPASSVPSQPTCVVGRPAPRRLPGGRQQRD